MLIVSYFRIYGQLELEGSPQELSQSSQRYRQLKAADDGDL